MSLKETFKHMRDLLSNITNDLEKADAGNKAASQRVRTGTVKLEKVAKVYRKESIAAEKKNKGQKKAPKASAPKSKAASSSAKKPAAPKAKASASSSKSKATVKAKPKAKATSFRARQMSVKRATAKLPTRRQAR